MAKQLILISNDDGVRAPGIYALKEHLERKYRVVIVAPEEEMSASSHAVTLKKPLFINRLEKDVYSVSGTPADCIIVALFYILQEKPAFILSGINLGQNLGEDVFYSGTVAAAREGALYGITSAAFSIVAEREEEKIYFESAAEIAEYVVSSILPRIKPGSLLNVNVPNLPAESLKGMRATTLSTRRYVDVVNEEDGFVVIGGRPIWRMEEGTDIVAVKEGFVSITPLLKDLTSYEEKEGLQRIIGETYKGNH